MSYDPWTGFRTSLDRVVQQLDEMGNRSVPAEELTARSQFASLYAMTACAHALWRIGTILETDQKWRDQLKGEDS